MLLKHDSVVVLRTRGETLLRMGHFPAGYNTVRVRVMTTQARVSTIRRSQTTRLGMPVALGRDLESSEHPGSVAVSTVYQRGQLESTQTRADNDLPWRGVSNVRGRSAERSVGGGGTPDGLL